MNFFFLQKSKFHFEIFYYGFNSIFNQLTTTGLSYACPNVLDDDDPDEAPADDADAFPIDDVID